MRTKTRLTIWLGILTLLVLVLGGISLGTIWNMGSEGKNVLTANYNSIDFARRMLDAIESEGDTARRSAILLAQLAAQQGNITERGEAGLTAQLASAVRTFRSSSADITRTRALRKDLNAIIDLNRAAIARKAQEAEDRADMAFLWISVAGTFCFLITFTLFLSLPEHIAEPIRILTEGIDRIAAGDYRERVEIEGNTEFRHMAERFNAMAGELQRWENSNLARVIAEKARAEAVINSLQDASIGVNDEGILLFANQQALELLNLDAREVVNQPVSELTARNDLLRHIMSSGAATPFKIVLDGKENYFTGSAVPIRSSSGPLGQLHVIRNITPFQERDLAKTNFLAAISHELKTPLASTDIGLGLLERSSPLGNEQREIVNDLRKDHARLLRIVSELLNLAHAENGKLSILRAPFRMSVAVDEAITALKSVSDQQGITVRQVGISALPMVLGDADRTVWVLVNLLGNAMRHAPKGSEIGIGGVREAEQVLISVRDQGPGIPRALRPHMFERFRHGRSRDEPHAGLGLAICREFMNAMGGDITYADDQVIGATFTLTFTIAHVA